MSTNPIVSVLMPVHNGGRYLRPAVESILNQSLGNLELILIDDGSSDSATQDLPHDPRLLIHRQPHRGIVASLTKAAAIAQAPFLARMDGDDIALPQRLEQQLALFDRRPGLGIVAARVEIFRDDGASGTGYSHYQRWVNSLVSPQDIHREIFVESPLPHPTVMIRSQLFHRLGGYRQRPWPEDYDLWLRAWSQGVPMAKPEPILLRWRDHDGRLSRNDCRYDLRAFMAVRAHWLSRTLLRDREAVIWGAAPTGAALCDQLRAAGARVLGFIDIDPRKIGGRKRGLPVWPDSEAANIRDALILGAVGSRGARARIRAFLQSAGKREGIDFVMTA